MLAVVESDGGRKFHDNAVKIIFEDIEKFRCQEEQFKRELERQKLYMESAGLGFTIKDSGSRAGIGGGVRDTEEGKTDYTLILDGAMYDRWAEHMTKGARKYAARNWLKFFATREGARAAYDRAGRSLARHYKDYMRGVRDEDHASAVFFNIDVRETALKIYPDLLGEGPAKEPSKGITAIP